MFRNKKNVKSDIACESYEDLKKEQKRTIYRLIAIVLAAGAVIAALSIAWFVSNTKVRAGGAGISADMKSVELKTSGSTGIHDDLLKKILSGDYQNPENGKLETSPEHSTVNWLLSDESKIGNYDNTEKNTNWEEYWKDSKHERRDKAIEPGSSGELKFYVVPKRDGTINLSMQLSLIPYIYKDNELKEVTEQNTKNFIYGHILFFCERENSSNGSGKQDVEWLKEGSFSIQIEDAKKNQEYQYTLYWCWPQNFAEFVLASGDELLNGNRPLLWTVDTENKPVCKFENGEQVRKEIVNEDSFSMTKNPGRYFYSNLTKNPLTTEQEEIEQIANIYKNSNSEDSEEMNENEKNAFIELSSYYNQADQYIGSNANCLRVQLEMVPVMQDEDK